MAVVVTVAEAVEVVSVYRTRRACCRRKVEETITPVRLRARRRAREGPPPRPPRKGEPGRSENCQRRWHWK